MTAVEPVSAPVAAQRAAAYLTSMLPEASAILLEEVEASEEKKKNVWVITLSFQRQIKDDLMSALISAPLGKREYKTFKIDSVTGDMLSMKMMKVI